MTDMDTWTKAEVSPEWLTKHNATKLVRMWGITFYEHPLKGDEAPVLAVQNGVVYNTQDFDLPTHDPREVW